MTDFENLGLSENTLEALGKKGFISPTPIQARTIPLLLNGEKDIMGQARTGTGKTAAFGLPIIERAIEGAGYVQALVLTPTRELALQVSDEINSLKGSKRLRMLPIYGGQSMYPQLKSLKMGVDIVVGTPGRILDHLKRGTLDLSQVSYFVLDEADEMINMGFIEDVRTIFGHVGENRRTMLFSATMPQQVMRIAEKFMGDYDVVAVKDEKSEATLTKQVFVEVAESDRLEALCRVIDAADDFYGLVFCRTKADADGVAGRLVERGYPAKPIHGDLNQAQRETILGLFRKRAAKILVATDVAARGIDVPDLTHVVNLALPMDPGTYVHRVGRTGRAGKEGVALTIISPREFRKLMFITRSAGMKVEKTQLPTVEDVIANKKARMAEEISTVLEGGSYASCLTVARELLEDKDPADVVAALLKHSYGNELDESSYRELRKPQMGGPGRVRLSAEVGRAHGMTPRKFVDFICRRARIQPFKVQNVKIMGRFTTFTTPSHEADAIMHSIGREQRDGRPMVRRK